MDNTTELEKYLTPDIPRIFEKRHPSEIPQEELPIVLLQTDTLPLPLPSRGNEPALRVVLCGQDDNFGRDLVIEEYQQTVDAMGRKSGRWVNNGHYSDDRTWIRRIYFALTGIDKKLTWTPGIDDQEPEHDPLNQDDDE